MKKWNTRLANVFFALSLVGGASLVQAAEGSMQIVDRAAQVDGSAIAPLDHTGGDPSPIGIDQCRRLDGNPNYCAQTRGCAFDRRLNQCRTVGVSRGSYCESFNGRYGECLNAGCSFDQNSGICFDRVSPQPRPQPQPDPSYCRNFDYDQFQCQDAGCLFDARSGLCRSQPNNPVPGFRFSCTAVDDGWEEHAGGHRGIGESQYSAQQAALGDCYRHHSGCHITQCQSN
jgi:hypothetical protein